MKYVNPTTKKPTLIARDLAIPQSQPLTAAQVKNTAGGYAWPVTDWTRLERFLILGSASNSYYASAKDLTNQSVDAIQRCLHEDGARVVQMAVDVSTAGRAPSNDEALFVLAQAAAFASPATKEARARLDALRLAFQKTTALLTSDNVLANNLASEVRRTLAALAPEDAHLLTIQGFTALALALEDAVRMVGTKVEMLDQRDMLVRRMALDVLPKVARTGTHLYHFVAYLNGLRGWGRGARHAVGNWFNALPADKLAYQLVKYQQRDGWSARDLLRLSHPKPMDEQHQRVYYWVTKGWPDIGPDAPNDAQRLLWVYEKAKRATTEAEVLNLINTYKLTWEFVPSQWHGSAAVWRALLPNLPLTALLRNLGRLTKLDLLTPFSAELAQTVAKLTDAAYIQKSRLHPLKILVASKTYAQGHGDLGDLRWTPNAKIVDALDTAFYLAFGNVEATGKRVMLALDVSGSMGSEMSGSAPTQTGKQRKGVPLTCREASAALALITANVEAQSMIVGFTADGRNSHTFSGKRRYEHSANAIAELAISPKQRLTDVVNYTSRLPMGNTDCALPMLYALERKLMVDAFVIFTDNETWAGSVHPAAALRQYREKMGLGAKLVVVALEGNGFTIADPADAGMLDVVGFDLNTPSAISAFIGYPDTVSREGEEAED